MYRYEAIAGRWNDNQCDIQVPYMCSMRRDPKYPEGQQINNNDGCPSGWVKVKKRKQCAVRLANHIFKSVDKKSEFIYTSGDERFFGGK